MTAPRTINKSESWCWQDKKVMRIIRENYQGAKKRTTVLAIYQTLTELASNAGSSSEFFASLSKIGLMSGKSIATIKRYTHDMVKMGILKIENRKYDATINLSNKWILLSPSVQYKEQPSFKDSGQTSVHNSEPQIEKNVLEQNIFRNDYLNSDGYKKAAKMRSQIGRMEK